MDPQLQDWNLQIEQPKWCDVTSKESYLRMLTELSFRKWTDVICDYSKIINSNCPASMFVDLKDCLINCRTNLFPHQKELALEGDLITADQEEKLEIQCKSFNRLLQHTVAKNLRSECTLLLPQISRWLSIIWKVKSSLPAEIANKMEMDLKEFRNFCKNQLHKEQLPLSNVVDYLAKYEQFIQNKEILQKAIRTSPLPIGSQYPVVLDLAIFLSQKKRPALDLSTRRNLTYPPGDVIKKYTTEMYSLSADYVRCSSAIMLKTFRKSLDDALKDTIYFRHLERIQNAIDIRQKKTERFVQHCLDMAQRFRNRWYGSSKKAFRTACETLNEAKFKVKDTSFKLRVYVRRRLTKLYTEVLKDVKELERKTKRQVKKLDHRTKNKCEKLLQNAAIVRQFWKRYLENILQELHENKSLQLIMNLNKNYYYFWGISQECRSIADSKPPHD